MKGTILVVALIIAITIVVWLVRRTSVSTGYLGDFRDIPAFLTKLIHATADDAFLIITIVDTGDFLQFSAAEGIVQMDYPLVTKRQRETAERLSAVCSQLGLTLDKNKGSDGTDFIDYDISGTSTEMAAVVQKVLEQAFDVSEGQKLVFEGNGLEEDNTSQPER